MNIGEKPMMFQIRTLIWEELEKTIYPAERQELREILGSTQLEENEALKEELKALVEILEDFQQQNDKIRDSINARPKFQDTPARNLLKTQIKLLLENFRSHNNQLPVHSEKDKKVLGYVLEFDNDNLLESPRQAAALTPRMKDLGGHGFPLQESAYGTDKQVLVRPPSRHSSRSDRRPSTASSAFDNDRPCSASSVYSAPAVVDSIHKRVSIFDIDEVKQALRTALKDEHQDLLEDIEFVQSCLDTENELISEDMGKMAPPTLQDLRELGDHLEEALKTKEQRGEMEQILQKAERGRNSLKPLGHDSVIECLPPPTSLAPHRPPNSSKKPPVARRAARAIPSDPTKLVAEAPRLPQSKVHRIRGLVQDVRDEDFLR